MDPTDDEPAQNQNIFRAGNEAIRANVGPDVAGIVLICECSDADCLERIGVRREEYDDVRANDRAFLLARGHERNGDEAAVVIDENDRFVVIEKLEEPGRTPRRPHRRPTTPAG